MHKYVLIPSGVLAVMAIALIVLLTSPSEVGPGVVLILILSIYIISLDVATLLLWLFSRGRKWSVQKCLRYAAVWAFVPIIAGMTYSVGREWVVSAICGGLVALIGSVIVSKSLA
jgi:hypothetical protein